MDSQYHIEAGHVYYEGRLVVPLADRSGWDYSPNENLSLEDICHIYPDYPEFFERFTGQLLPVQLIVTPQPSLIERIAAKATPREPHKEESNEEE